MDFAADNSGKIKWKDGQIVGSCQRTEKAVEYEDDNWWCWYQLTMMLILTGTVGMVTKGLESRFREIGDQRKNQDCPYHNTLVMIIRRVLEMWGDLLALRSQWKTDGEKLTKNSKKKNELNSSLSSLWINECAEFW